MENNSNDQRIEILRKDGSDMFLEGDISGATDMYIAAMRLDLDQHIQRLLAPKQQECNNNVSSSDEENSSERSNKHSTDGIDSVITATLQSADEAIRINPSLPKPYKSKATALILQNKWDEAREVYLAGIKSCGDCEELRQGLHKLYKTQTLLQRIPHVLERTRSVSSDTSESTFDGGRSPTSKARRFRLQHRKKLSRPMVGFINTSSIQSLKSSQEEEEDDDDDNDDDGQDVDTTNTTT